ncbi:MAG TPA: hypothetical protein VG326_02645 [Tepidisphaeraceae bacterium]|jgi:hypothetical protein|nr:hypothetical protein [Tepidisphaeraceae bacterium]
MAHSPEHNPASPEALELGYQPEAISAKGLLIFLVLFIACAAILHALLWVLMKKLEARDMRFDSPRSIAQTAGREPPPPNLQPSVGHDVTDVQDMETLRQTEDAIFIKMGWRVDPATHEIGIPPQIAREVAEEARARASAPFVPPTTTGKNSNSIVPGSPPENDVHQGIKGAMPP